MSPETSTPEGPSPASPSYLAWGLILIACVAGLVLWTQRGRLAPAAPLLVPASKVLKLYGDSRQIMPDPALGEHVRKARVQLQRTEQRMKAIAPSDPTVTRTAAGTILSDFRDGWLAAHATQFEVDLPPDVTGTLRVDVALLYNNELEERSVELPDGLGMKFSVGLVDGDATPRPLVGGTFAADLDGLAWNPLSCPLSTFEMTRPRLVFQSLLVGVEPAQLSLDVIKNVVACWANPMLVRDRVDVPNVIVLSIDTLRADHLGCYGYERDTSPNLDALVARGVLFENAISAAPWTLPSYGALFTGRYPSSHRAGVHPQLDVLWGSADCGLPIPISQLPIARQTRQLAPCYVTLAEALRDQGYRTCGLFNNPFLHPSRGIDQGFERYAWYQHTAEVGVGKALEWIDEQHGVPFFLFLHLMDPHMPYAPPPPFDERYAGRPLAEHADVPWTLGEVRERKDPESYKELLVDLYDGEIAYTDQELGRFVRELERRRLFENTIFVLHSDHGEEFFDHGGFEHGHALHKELLHVPLAIVYPPKIAAGTHVTARVRTVDVFPTVLELLGLQPEVAELHKGRLRGDGATLNARSLVEWIEGARGDDLDTLSESMLYGPPHGAWWEQKARYEGRFKLIVGGQTPGNELYDLADDPFETTNVLMRHWEEARGIRTRLVEAASTLANESCSSDPSRPPKEVLDAMKGVGYTGDPDPSEPERDPADPGGAHPSPPDPGGAHPSPPDPGGGR